ncbi:cyclodeaminase/cyclohydrolase family protein [Parasporobacterium paucivorans]|uniref:Formiminotetrahydrofolate cyclodeaminase n=1 Tax=Parasporobacterium paucivorans DSM 15970 TaxID=1122934 RepID=A0A1M6G9J4_9FIRM|nr:cyclodeaminase/cyclohydrolase family protein [Parasporobacterium paucivorans]SHJ06640.1 Formiminotetrahydrofolate cyclodeaminase [Parasporobacterium paucivorans DSM 15970]
MDFKDFSCVDFVEVLASKEPVPGGGGASALVAAVGMALGNMVGSLTIGKKKYADVQDDIIALKEKADRLQTELLDLMQEDAKMFEPLSKAYGLPKETEEEKAYKAQVMEECLRDACAVPLKIMEKCGEAIDIIQEFAQKGTALAISDAGVGAAFCRSAIMGASLNVFINTKSMTDKDYAGSINKKADDMLQKYTALAENIFTDVLGRLK